MKLNRTQQALLLQTDVYTLRYEDADPYFVKVQFGSGISARLYIASGCDRDDGIDELIALQPPRVDEIQDRVLLTFEGRTTLWDRVEYVFDCGAETLVYGYKVFGSGQLETVRFFEGFRQNDPRLEQYFYPYFCGPKRELAYHRPVKDFLTSSEPGFDHVYSFCVNSSDKRIFQYYESCDIRVNGDRHYFGGDWLATPSPFLYLMGRKRAPGWVSLGLAVKSGEAGFMGYKYEGGEGFGLQLDYMGYTEVDGCWESPRIVLQETKGDEYEALDRYLEALQALGGMPAADRRAIPTWWKQPIFGGWGEQVFHSNRWDNFFSGEHNDWSHDNVDRFCTQAAYEEMLATLEAKGINPTILIIDNRWFRNEAHLDVDTGLWPDLKGFIADQHAKGRKVILWVSPWGVSMCSKGKDVPIAEHMLVDEDKLYDLELDTDVFYAACKREHKKVRRSYPLPEPTLTDANWRYTADPQNPAYVDRLKKKIAYLLGADGLNADGFEFDYTHFLPKFRGTRPVTPRVEKTKWGIEALHHIIGIYHRESKKVKDDALIISHTFNPYFNDVIDMLRLQDIYTDKKSIVPQMEHRAKIAHRVAPGCAVHTDQHPMPSLEAWREYARFQPSIGNPCTYYVTGIETTKERFTTADFELLKGVWEQYEQTLKATETSR
jgi:hypothetical protein